MKCSAYQDLIARIEKKELECFGSVCDGDIPERCTNLEKYYKIFVFDKIIDKKQIHSCILEEEFFTALSLRVHYIENNIDITDRMNKKNILSI